MAPASCSLWPCCERGVTSCLSLCLFLALPEGPRGTGRGCDGSTADPRGYGPPGPCPGCLPASAASAVEHCCGTRRSCRVPGSFLCKPPPPSPLLPPASPTLHPQGRRHCHRCQQAGCVISSAPDPQPYRLTQLDMHRKSHTCPHTFMFVHSHKCLPAQGHAGADIKAQTHHEFRDTWTHAAIDDGSHTHNSKQRYRITHTDSHIYVYSDQRAVIGATV